MSQKRLPPKLETVLVAWINQAKADRLQPATIAGETVSLDIRDAHTSSEPTPPYISVWCPSAPPHPDFAGMTGASWPRRATVHINMKCTCVEGVSYEPYAKWADELMDVLTQREAGREADEQADFSAFIAAANLGGAIHPEEGLYITGIKLTADDQGVTGAHWLFSVTLEIDANNFDPSPN